ncbi:M20 family metallopeptidase [Thermoproteus tenax]|uniref:Probable succinyl-diaminopimelate desuccinylase n=1 Tax=Thermoproteus tenax (strain ATCC 35583 / DSM 2078 / JCM 9277 / NBRC 100435 / Kra 1) TaxID=768679 RepID=G4RPK3_THETK|nr:M20 family metallopeptidase [Thermoproteus tenax]CCC81498.1 succinyl-diaminopimelate desuccinylase [Thermoproteus tenax Kra 1]
MSSDLKNQLAELTSRLVQINSVNPPGDVTNVTDFIKDWLNAKGFSSSIYEYVKGKPNLIAKVGSGKPTLILNGHTDVVPPGDISKWAYPPFSGKIVEGKIYGRGSTDMKGGLAVIMMVFAELAPLVEKKGTGTLIFSATADEEVGGHAGVEALVKDNILIGDAAIIAEPTGFDKYCIGEKGLCQVRLVTRGKPAHGSLPILGDNAIVKLIKAIERARICIDEFNRGIKHPQDLIEAIDNATEVYLEGALKSGLRLSKDDLRATVGLVSFNPGVIKGGSKINMVPDYAELELDMRVPPGVSPSNVVDKLRGELSGLAEVEVIDLSEPNYTSSGEMIVQLIRDGIAKQGAEPKPIIITGATDGRYLRLRGIPTVVYGPGDLTLAHSYNEYVAIDDLVKTYNVIKYVSEKYLGLRID